MPKSKKEKQEEPEEEPEEETEEQEGEISENEGLEDIEETGINIGNFQFQDFIRSSIEESAPVLERIAGSQGVGFSLSGWEALSSPVTSEGTIEEGDPFKYSVGGGAEEGEAKYVSLEHVGAIPNKVDVSRVGREQIITPDANQEAFISQASEMRNNESSNLEKYEPAQRMDVERAGREDPFEREERKYDPKLPK